MVRGGFPEAVTFQLRGTRSPLFKGRGNSTCKGPETGMSLRKEEGQSGGSQVVRGRKGGSEVPQRVGEPALGGRGPRKGFEQGSSCV